MKKYNLLFIVLLILSFAVIQNCGGNAENLSVGNPAPDFTLQDSVGNSYSLSSYKEKNPVTASHKQETYQTHKKGNAFKT